MCPAVAARQSEDQRGTQEYELVQVTALQLTSCVVLGALQAWPLSEGSYRNLKGVPCKDPAWGRRSARVVAGLPMEVSGDMSLSGNRRGKPC